MNQKRHTIKPRKVARHTQHVHKTAAEAANAAVLLQPQQLLLLPPVATCNGFSCFQKGLCHTGRPKSFITHGHSHRWTHWGCSADRAHTTKPVKHSFLTSAARSPASAMLLTAGVRSALEAADNSCSACCCSSCQAVAPGWCHTEIQV